MDEMLELYKGQLSYADLFKNLSYREALYLRDARVDRLKKEREEMERERKELEAKQRREAILNRK